MESFVLDKGTAYRECCWVSLALEVKMGIQEVGERWKR